ncbi:DUF4230 domain-containing protein [Chryseomicrobium aureum]|uniref:DUF4230 domain-containing protein n=1 Tax=Chryseomicrobium aureum TaxID=1441723 RepID=UPI00370D800A
MTKQKRIQELEKLLQDMKREEAATYAEPSAPTRTFRLPWKAVKFIPKKFILLPALILAALITLAIVVPMYFSSLFSGSTFTEQKGAIVERLSNLEQLVTAESVTKVFIEREDNQLFGQDIGINLPGTLRQVLVVIPGKVTAGVDLSNVSADDIEIDEEAKTATLRIAAPEVIGEPTILFEEVDIYSYEGLFRDQPDISEAYDLAAEARVLMIEEASQQGLLELARTNAEQTLSDMFQLVDYDVTIEFEE